MKFQLLLKAGDRKVRSWDWLKYWPRFAGQLFKVPTGRDVEIRK